VAAPNGVTIRAGGTISGTVTAGDPDQDQWGWADLNAGTDVSGSVTAAGGAWVSAGGTCRGGHHGH